MPLFCRGEFEENSEIDALFVDLLRLAPDKIAFLGRFASHVHSYQGSGSLKVSLEDRREQLVKLADDMPGEVANWVQKGLPDLDLWIASVAKMDRD